MLIRESRFKRFQEFPGPEKLQSGACLPFFWNLESLASGIENRSGCRPDQRATARRATRRIACRPAGRQFTRFSRLGLRGLGLLFLALAVGSQELLVELVNP